MWAYNTQVYYESMGRSAEEIGSYMSWIPIVGGLISTVVGGIISDRIVLRRGPNARILVCIVSLVSMKSAVLFFRAGYRFLDSLCGRGEGGGSGHRL